MLLRARRFFLSDPDVGHQRQVIRGDEREAGARQLDADHFHFSRVVNVIEVQHREESRIGALRPLAREKIAQIDAANALNIKLCPKV